MSVQSNGGSSSELSDAERKREMDEAVIDLPDPERDELTREDVDILRRADLVELAEFAERYVPA